MRFTPLELAGAYLIEEEPRRDPRGHLSRVFCAREFAEHGLEFAWAQMNRSRSLKRGTIRGLHYQVPPAAEAKLFQCLRGSVLHVMVDVRQGSETFLRWHAERLTGDGGQLILIPRGVAHGVQTLADDVEILYGTSNYYAAEHERGIRWDDPRVGIVWPITGPEIVASDKDQAHPLLGPDFAGVRL